jgi:type II secretory pathway component PulF
VKNSEATLPPGQDTESRKQALRSMIEDFQELKKALKQQSKSQLIQNIVNLIHNQLALIDAVQALQAQLQEKESKEKEEKND